MTYFLLTKLGIQIFIFAKPFMHHLAVFLICMSPAALQDGFLFSLTQLLCKPGVIWSFDYALCKG